MTYPTTLDSLVHPTDGVTDAAEALFDPWVDAINALEAYLGTTADSASNNLAASKTANIKYLLAAPGGIAKQDSAPGSPSTNDLWIETDQTTRPLSIFYSSAWHLVGANALTLQGFTVHTTTPTDGQVLTWDNGNSRWAPATAAVGLTDPMTTIGDLIYRNSSNVSARLGIGSAGQFLGISAGLPAWTTPAYIPLPASAVQGSVLYFDGATWVQLPPGSTGQFLKTQTAGANPIWATPPSSAPGDGILDPGGETQGSILYYNGTDWAQLSPGTSGFFLKTNGASANPAWAAPATGFTNPMTTLSDIIIGDTGGAAIRLPIGTSSQILTVVAGAPAWATASITAAPDYATINWAAGD